VGHHGGMRRWGALAAGLLSLLAAPAASGTPSEGAHDPGALTPCQRAEEMGLDGAPVDVELVTVTASSFEVTWLTCRAGQPAAADTVVRYGTSPDPSTWKTVVVRERTPYHHARVERLKPGRLYRYEVFSNGLPGRPDRYHPGRLRTLDPPGGKPLFTFAVLADVHVGEDVSGRATGLGSTNLPPSYRGSDYATAMAQAAVAEVNKHGVDFVILPGDSTSSGTLGQTLALREVLDGLEAPYMIARGSHDVPKGDPACGVDGDCFRHVFYPEVEPAREAHHLFTSRVVGKRYRFVALDSSVFPPPSTPQPAGQLDAAQLDFLRRELAAAKAAKQEAFVFFHHPVTPWSTTLAVPPLVFGVRQDQAQEFLQVVGDDTTVRAVVTSHTHRNWLTYAPETGRIPFVEAGPSKEYPGGYTIVDVYRHGFTRTFYRTGGRVDCAFCRRWQAVTRGEYAGRYPDYTTGSLRDRNFSHRWDGPDVPGLPSLPFNFWPPGAPLTG
jgi:Icc protein